MADPLQQPQELDTVQHPFLGPLKFPSDMPFEQRNKIISQQEQAYKNAPPQAQLDWASGPTLKDTPSYGAVPEEDRTAAKLASFLPDWTAPVLAGAKKYLVDPFERLQQAGAQKLGDVAANVAALPETLATAPNLNPSMANPRLYGPTAPGPSPVEKAEREYPAVMGAARGVGEFAGGLAADVRNWPLMAERGPATAIKRLMSMGFGASMLKSAADRVPEIQEAIKRGDSESAARLITNAGLSGAVGVAGVTHGLRESEPKAESSRGQVLPPQLPPAHVKGELPPVTIDGAPVQTFIGPSEGQGTKGRDQINLPEYFPQGPIETQHSNIVTPGRPQLPGGIRGELPPATINGEPVQTFLGPSEGQGTEGRQQLNLPPSTEERPILAGPSSIYGRKLLTSGRPEAAPAPETQQPKSDSSEVDRSKIPGGELVDPRSLNIDWDSHPFMLPGDLDKSRERIAKGDEMTALVHTDPRTGAKEVVDGHGSVMGALDAGVPVRAIEEPNLEGAEAIGARAASHYLAADKPEVNAEIADDTAKKVLGQDVPTLERLHDRMQRSPLPPRPETPGNAMQFHGFGPNGEEYWKETPPPRMSNVRPIGERQRAAWEVAVRNKKIGQGGGDPILKAGIGEDFPQIITDPNFHNEGWGKTIPSKERYRNQNAPEQVAKLHQQNGGATYNVYKGDLSGKDLYAVGAHPDRSVTLDHAPTPDDIYNFLQKNKDLLHRGDRSIGTWDAKDGRHILDVTATLSDRDEAMKLAREKNQEAIYHLGGQGEIPVNARKENAPVAERPNVTTLRAFHYSDEPNLQTLDPEFYGRNALHEKSGNVIQRPDLIRKSAFPQYWKNETYLGQEGSEDFRREAADRFGLRKYTYAADIDKSKVYDFLNDPLHIKDQARNELLEENRKAYGVNMPPAENEVNAFAISKLRDLGYTGRLDTNGLVAMWEKTPVQRLEESPAKHLGQEAAPSYFRFDTRTGREYEVQEGYKPKPYEVVTRRMADGTEQDIARGAKAFEAVPRQSAFAFNRERGAASPDFLSFISTGGLSEIGKKVVESFKGKNVVEGWPEVARLLPPEDRENVNRRLQQGVMDAIDQLGDPTMIEEAAKAGSIARGWYKRTGALMNFIFGRDSNKFIDFFAALSPLKTVEQNMIEALNFYSDWVEAGKPRGVGSGEQVRRILPREAGLAGGVAREQLYNILVNGAEPSGQKVSNFAKNLKGEMDVITKDRLMAYLFGWSDKAFESKAKRLAADATIRAVAKKLDMLPAEVQESGWSFVRTVLNMKEQQGMFEGTEQGGRIEPDEAARQITEQDIRAGSSEFAAIIRDNSKVRAALDELAKRTGNERFKVSSIESSKKYQQLIAESGRTRGVAGGLAGADREVLARTAQRAAAAQRGEPYLENGDTSFDTNTLNVNLNPLDAVGRAYTNLVGKKITGGINDLYNAALGKIDLATGIPLKRALRSPESYLPDIYSRAKTALQATVFRGKKEALSLGERLSKGLDQTTQQTLMRVVNNSATPADLALLRSTPRLQDALDAAKLARIRLNSLGAESVIQDLLKAPTFFQNYGKYVPRLYRLHEVDYNGMLNRTNSTAPSRMDLSRFRKRDDIPPIVRAAMGEITEAAYPVARGISDLTHDVAYAKFFDKVSTNANWASDVQRPGWIQMPETDKLGKLSGKWVDRDIARDVNEMIHAPTEAAKFWTTMMGKYKKVRVVWAPGSFVWHNLSRGVLNYLDGLPPTRVDVYAKALIDRAKEGPLYQQAIDNGVIHESHLDPELFNDLIDSWNKSQGNALHRFMQMGAETMAKLKSGKDFQGSFWNHPWWTAAREFKPVEAATGGLSNKVTALYSALDQWMKMAKFSHNLEKGMTPWEAGKDARKATIDYRNVPKLVDWSRRTITPFITFPTQALPRLAKSAIEAPWRLLTIYAILSSLQEHARNNLGITQAEDDENRRLSRPQGVEGAGLDQKVLGFHRYMLLPSKDSSGRFQYLDLNHLLHWTGVGQPPAPGMTPFGTTRPLGDLSLPAEILQREFYGHPITSMVGPVMFNKDPYTGKELYGPGQEFEGPGSALASRIYRTWAPGIAPGGFQYNKVKGALEGREDYFGRASEPGSAAFQVLSGLNVRPLDPGTETGFRTREFKAAEEDLRKAIYRTAADQRLTPEERDKKLQELGSQRDRVIERYNSIFQPAQR